MIYNEKNGFVEIKGPELVFYARKRNAITYLPEDEEAIGTDAGSFWKMQLIGRDDGTTLVFDVKNDEYSFTIFQTVEEIEEKKVTLIRKVTGDPSKPTKEAIQQARGEAFLAAYILYKSCGELSSIRIFYVNEDYPLPYEVNESPSIMDLERFFEKILQSACVHAAPELDRVTRRLPTLKRAMFPYPKIRSGQRDMMTSVYQCIKGERKLYVSAPTGIGKTMSALYPAIRALGEGIVEKAFYFTSKNTGAISAKDALEQIAKQGVLVRGILLSSKENSCPNHLVCRKGNPEFSCNLSPLAQIREDNAARKLLSLEIPAVTIEDILPIAFEFQVCPYELALRYSQYCDIIVCDYNYLFNPMISIRRYFLTKHEYVFLVDEAHNLGERVRNTFESKLKLSDYRKLENSLSVFPHLQELAHSFTTYLQDVICKSIQGEITEDKDGNKQAFVSSKTLPNELYSKLCYLVYALEKSATSDDLGENRDYVQKTLVSLRQLLNKILYFGEEFIIFYQLEKEEYRMDILCLDPAKIIADRLELGSSSVMFSATISPIDYYKDILGGDRASKTLEVESPFNEENLCLLCLDKISTRYMEREATTRAIVKSIIYTVKSHPGNYMVFCPSYHYLNLIYTAIKKAVPALPMLLQKPNMTPKEREEFLLAFQENAKTALLGFCVMGGVYSEGIDLVGKRLIGAIIVGVGLPSLSNEREAIREYFDQKNEEGKAYAYVYPGMNRVLQAAGRVIRTEEDRGVVLLIDDRFGEMEYRKLIPEHFRKMKYIGDVNSLTHVLLDFWGGK